VKCKVDSRGAARCSDSHGGAGRASPLRRSRTGGFTVLEIASAVVIVGIIAAVTAPRFFDDKTFLERGSYEELAASLKYARKLAIVSSCPVRVQMTAHGYTASRRSRRDGGCDATDSSWSTNMQLADGQLLSGASPVGVSSAPAVTITFDALGRTDLPSDQRITVGQFALTVIASTGLVEAP
jgi:MSHA pilin protein MshC